MKTAASTKIVSKLQCILGLCMMVSAMEHMPWNHPVSLRNEVSTVDRELNYLALSASTIAQRLKAQLQTVQLEEAERRDLMEFRTWALDVDVTARLAAQSRTMSVTEKLHCVRTLRDEMITRANNLPLRLVGEVTRGNVLLTGEEVGRRAAVRRLRAVR